jgi:thermitase
MRGHVWAAVAGLVLSVVPAPAVQAAPVGRVTLVAGLRSGADVVAGLRRHHVTVVGSRKLTGAVAVTVPAGQAATATSVLRADRAVAYVEPDAVARAAETPDDPDYGGQWGIRQTGVDTVWDSTHGSGAVTVAVVDSGVSPIADLAGRLLPGKDFVNGDGDASDDLGHGTQAADVIAGAGDNGRGIAGLCWACRILPVKVLDATGTGSYSTIAEGIRYAADRGADIINLSLGGSSDSRILRSAVAYAVAKGALVVAAAGNNASAAPHYPAAIPAVLAVGASTAGEAQYPFSNHGAGWVDLAAPGCNPSSQPSGIITTFCGTSSSAPFVAGVAALLASSAPGSSAAVIRTALTSTAHPLAGHWVAAGRVDAAAALAAVAHR